METFPPWSVEILIGVGGLFTKGEWKAIITLVVATIAGTHTVKIAWRLSPLAGCDGTCINLIAAVLGFAFSYFVWPNEAWWVFGIIAGPLAIACFKIFFAFLKRFAPKFAAFLNADRRIDPMPIPPNGSPDRRKSG